MLKIFAYYYEPWTVNSARTRMYFFRTFSKRTKKIHYKIREMENTTIFMNLILLISIKQKN